MKSFNIRLQHKLAELFSIRNVILFSSCRNALYTLLCSFHLKTEDEVIIQSFICDSLVLAITKAGATPRKVDVNSQTLNVDASIVRGVINSNTKAIIFVHTYGNPTGIEEIRDLCRERGIILIEDIAHALGARFNGKLAGTFGDYAVYSFTKQMVNFGGGAVLTNHDVQEIVAFQQKHHGKPPMVDYVKRFIGSLYETRAFFLSKLLIDFVRKRANLKLAQELSPHSSCSLGEAFLAYSQLDFVLRGISRRRRNYHFLKNRGCKLQHFSSEASPAYSYLSLCFSSKTERDMAMRHLFVSLPPWPGSPVSDRLLFIPNRPMFSKRVLRRIARACSQRDNQELARANLYTLRK